MSFDPNNATNAVNKAIQHSIELCERNGNPDLTPAHLAYVLFTQEGSLAVRIANKLNIITSSVVESLNDLVQKCAKQSPPPSNVYPNHSFKNVLRTAEKLKASEKAGHIAIDHLLVALYEDDHVSRVLQQQGLPKRKVEETVRSLKGSNPNTSRYSEDHYDALNKYGHDLTQDAENGKLDPVIGRDNEIRRVIQVLSRRTKNNPVLIGDPGVGKTAIVEGLAQRIVLGDVPSTLKNRKVISLDMGALVAGASHHGEFEDRLKSVLKEVKDSEGGVILFIDEIHIVLGAGKTSGAMDAANLLKPMLARGELRCIGATTLDEYRKYIEKDPAFERRFQQVTVDEPSVEDTVSILRGLKERYENHHGVRIKDNALVIAAQLANRYITTRFLPDKAIDLIDEACASTRVQLDSRPVVIDELERRQLQLEVEETALSAEKDEASQARLQTVREELSRIKEQLQPLLLQHESERGRVKQLMQLKQKLEETYSKMYRAEREKNLALAADLKYGAIPEIEKKIAEWEKKIEEEKAQSDDTNKLLTDVVGVEQVAEIVSRWTGIPVTKLSQTARERLLKLNEHLHKRLIGQEEAVTAVSNAVLRSRAGLARENQPTGSFLFLGPTGVGKTELAKALAEELFDDEKQIIRIDMSEYMEQHSVARLIGAPPGYVGYDEGGQLTEAVRRRPYSVVLFDEVEKAHTSIWNVLLQVLDDGRLTDGKGKIVDFTNTVIIMTSNLGAEHLLNAIGKDGVFTNEKEAKNKVMNEVKRFFRPEFLNRLDDIVIFSPLTTLHLRKIITLQLGKLASRLLDRNIQVELDDKAIKRVMDQAYDPIYGARPLKRWIERYIVTDLSKQIISGNLKNNTLVTITADPNLTTTGVSQGVRHTDFDEESGLLFKYTPLTPTVAPIKPVSSTGYYAKQNGSNGKSPVYMDDDMTDDDFHVI